MIHSKEKKKRKKNETVIRLLEGRMKEMMSGNDKMDVWNNRVRILKKPN